MTPTPHGSSEPYQFSDADLSQFGPYQWACPTRLVRSGLWASLWRSNPRAIRGGGTTTAVLPLLALLTWPGKRVDELDEHRKKFRMRKAKALPNDNGQSWTPWACVPCREAAAICGVSKNGPGRALRHLEAAGLAQYHTEPRAPGEGGQLQFYRLHESLYAERQGDRYTEPFALLPGRLFYGGVWSMLPDHSHRQLYVTLTCLQAVHDERALVDVLEECHVPDLEEEGDGIERVVDDIRASSPVSMETMQELSGLSESAVRDARNVLLLPLVHAERDGMGNWRGTEPLFIWTASDVPNVPCYSRNAVAVDAAFSSAFLNSKEARREYARSCWPGIAEAAQEKQDKASRAGVTAGIIGDLNRRNRAA